MAPGIQEEFLLDFVLEKVREGGYDVIVWDTAPAGDTLRLLDLPYRFLNHLRAAPKVYLSVRDRLQLKSVPFLTLIDGWRALSQEITRFFRDPDNAEFILVTIPEALGVYQAGRTINELAKFGLHVRHLVVNQVVVEPDSGFLGRRQAMQRPYLDLLEHNYGDHMEITHIPLFAEEMKGVNRLQELQGLLFSAAH
jgi:arsenite-transporting ATPase